MEHIRLLEQANPIYKERHVESSRPGELLCQDAFYVGHLKGIGKVYLQAVVDTFGSYAFGYLATSKLPAHNVALLHNDVIPFYAERKITINALLTDNGREFYATPNHQFEHYLDLNEIEHRRTRVSTTKANGFVERFNERSSKSSSARKCEASCTSQLRRCKPISISGCATTTSSGRIVVTAHGKAARGHRIRLGQNPNTRTLGVHEAEGISSRHH